MRTFRSIIILASLVFTAISSSYAQGWRQIAPLKSTRVDVDRLLGLPQDGGRIVARYETPNERVIVYYSSKPCKSGGKWNVPPNTVVRFTIYPNSKMPVSALNLDETTYKRTRDPHAEGFYHYVNSEAGIRVAAMSVPGGDELVAHLTHEAATRDNDRRCPGAAPLPELPKSAPPAHKFDEFSTIRSSDERARLDSFAAYLDHNPDLVGYVIAYAGRRALVGEATARANQIKTYLVRKRGMRPEQINTIDGGYRESKMIELFVTITGVPPTATPRLNRSQVKIIRPGPKRT